MSAKLEFEVERQALALFVQKWKASYLRVVKAIEPDYLQAEPYRWFLTKFQWYWKEYQVPIPWEYVDVLIRRDFSEESAQAEMRDIVYKLYTSEITWGERAVQDFREYIAWRVYTAGVSEVQAGFRKSRSMSLAIDHGQMALDKANVVLHDLVAHDLGDDFEAREAHWKHERDNPKLRNRVFLGIDELDKRLKLDAGTLTAFLAPFGRGKSIFLNHVGVCALAMGYNVAHITFENSVEMTEDRYFSRLTTINYDDLVVMRVDDDPERYRQAREHVMGIKTHLHNRIKIIQATARKTKVSEVEAQLNLLAQEDGWIPDVTVWDYINLLAPSKDHGTSHDNQEQVAWDLCEHANDAKNGGLHKKVAVTAMQTKAEGINKAVLTPADFGKSIGIMQALYNCIGINQTDQEMLDGEFRLNDLKMRDSKRGPVVQVKCDLAWMCVDTRSWKFVNDQFAQRFMNGV